MPIKIKIEIKYNITGIVVIMIHIKHNQCPVCLESGLSWNINITKSDMHMFKCGHGTCKSCFNKLRSSQKGFCCPLCRDSGQQYYLNFQANGRGMWLTFAEWYNEYEIYINCGCANNILRYSSFGQQLTRLIRESKKIKAMKSNNSKSH